MKIVYIANSIIPSRHANSVHVMKMCQAFAHHGHEVYLIVPNWQGGKELGINNVFDFYGVDKCFQIMYLPIPFVNRFESAKGFLFAFYSKKMHADIVYGRYLMGCYFASLLKIPVVFESHAPINGKIRNWVFQKLINHQQFIAMAVITNALKTYYLEKYPFHTNRIMVAPDGSDPISPLKKPVCFPNNGRKLQVGYVGHLYAGRGIEIIEAMAKSCKWADFHIIGGREKDISHYKKKTELVTNLIFHGFKSPAEAEKYRLGCDVLLAPYQHKVTVLDVGNTVQWMSPLKIFEYMAAGKAIIASDLPALWEVLTNEVNCLLCPASNADLWIKMLERLHSDTELRMKLGENARNDFLQHYSWLVRGKNILSFIDNLKLV